MARDRCSNSENFSAEKIVSWYNTKNKLKTSINFMGNTDNEESE
jgi:hypothetical protein